MFKRAMGKVPKIKLRKKKDFKYKVSVIIPVYNTEDYIQETLDSIYKQTMKLKDIQLILVNDGSTDNTDKILKKNARRHPKNITYINKVNEGVSIARNTGLKYAEGKYVNFIDSDDKWGLKTFEAAYKFMESNPDVDVVSTRLSFFDSLKGEHPLNYKFDKKQNRVVDLLSDYNNIQMHASSSFFRRTAIGNAKFDSKLKYAEDAKFVYEVLKKTYKLGLLSYLDGCYYYRKRADESSAIDTANYKKEYYLPTLEGYHQFLINDSRENLGYVPKYIQTVLLYDLQYRFKYSDVTLEQLNESEIEQYSKKILGLLSVIEDEVLDNPDLKVMNVIYKTAILKERYKEGQFKLEIEDSTHNIYFNNIFIKSIEDMYLKNESMYVKEGILKLSFSLPLITDEYFVEPVIKFSQGHVIKADKITILNDHYFLGKKVSQTNFYRFDIPLNKIDGQFTIKYLVNGKIMIDVNQVSKTLKTNFSNTKVPFKHFEGKTIRVFEHKKFVVTQEKKYLTIKNILGLLLKRKTRKSGIYKLIGLRIKRQNKERVWIFTDRVEQAEDNAEALFDYVYRYHKEIKPYFIISKKSPDYKRLKKVYKSAVVPFDSKKYHLLMFKAERMITSHTEPYLFNPFGVVNGKYVRELLDYDFVFLQHGVTQNNVRKLLHKYNKPIDVFITSAQRETEDIIDKYGFLKSEVKQTGLARFDLLESKDAPKKIITFMPTWRPALLKGTDEDFVESEFFKRTYGFLNDEKLKQWIRNDNIELQFHLHPRMRERFTHFYDDLKEIVIPDYPDYKKIISYSSLLITDVSSVAFDVAYLNKPVIYYQFDLDDIYKQAIYDPGYYDYKTDGFGPVLNNEVDLIKSIGDIKEHEFKISEKYQNHVNAFFAYHDKQNRRRIFEVIK